MVNDAAVLIQNKYIAFRAKADLFAQATDRGIV